MTFKSKSRSNYLDKSLSKLSKHGSQKNRNSPETCLNKITSRLSKEQTNAGLIYAHAHTNQPGTGDITKPAGNQD